MLEVLARTSPKARAKKLYDWHFWSRPNQRAPEGNWRVWLLLAGRGFGKTRAGGEWVRERVRRMPYVNLIAATADDARDIMVEGESGILAICPDDERPIYRTSLRRLDWPNGARSLIFTADEPERLRGKQHMSLWADELGAWRYPEAWHQAMFGLRIGPDPRAVVTTTPKPTPLIRELFGDPNTAVTRGSSYDNRANLNPAFYEQIIKRYEGTRLGRQELEAEILLDNPAALWHRADLDQHRVTSHPDLTRIIVGVDPSISDGEEAAETGIIVGGLGVDGHGYVLEDLSLRSSPAGWAAAAVTAYNKYRANRITAEANQGGLMVEHTIHSIQGGAGIPVNLVRASHAKVARAEPVAALYEQGRIHHLGTFAQLEDQQCEWMPGEKSPDRIDALVWAFTDLFDLTDEPIDPFAALNRYGAAKGWSPRL